MLAFSCGGRSVVSRADCSVGNQVGRRRALQSVPRCRKLQAEAAVEKKVVLAFGTGRTEQCLAPQPTATWQVCERMSVRMSIHMSVQMSVHMCRHLEALGGGGAVAV